MGSQGKGADVDLETASAFGKLLAHLAQPNDPSPPLPQHRKVLEGITPVAQVGQDRHVVTDRFNHQVNVILLPGVGGAVVLLNSGPFQDHKADG